MWRKIDIREFSLYIMFKSILVLQYFVSDGCHIEAIIDGNQYEWEEMIIMRIMSTKL